MEVFEKLFFEQEKENIKLKHEIEKIWNPDDSQKAKYYSQPSNQKNEIKDSKNQSQNKMFIESNYKFQNLVSMRISQIHNKPNWITRKLTRKQI